MAHRLGVALLATFGMSVSPGLAAEPAILSVEAILEGPTSLDLFRRPGTLAVAPDGAFFVVADTGKSRLVLFDANGRCRGTLPLFAGTPTDPGVEPRALAIDERGRLFVVDGLSPEVLVLSPRGRDLAILTVPAEWGLVDARPGAVAVDGGRVYILHLGGAPGLYSEHAGGRDRVVHEMRAGLKSVASPTSFALSPDGTRFAILDPPADRQVQVRGTDGTLLASFGRHGEGEGTISMAAHVAWGPNDTLWITDTLRHTVSVFDAQGGFLGHVGGAGSGPGQFLYPAAAGFLAGDRLVVLERGSQRCQILALQLPSTEQEHIGTSWESGSFSRSS